MARTNIGEVEETKYGIQGLEYIPEERKNTEKTRGRK